MCHSIIGYIIKGVRLKSQLQINYIDKSNFLLDHLTNYRLLHQFVKKNKTSTKTSTRRKNLKKTVDHFINYRLVYRFFKKTCTQSCSSDSPNLYIYMLKTCFSMHVCVAVSQPLVESS